ncbi:MAG: hypothetical protein RBT69_09380 [Spirochaetia bacterium]|jgi:hypothetical protein|nr:hypothetical protein [Spirochaetia bacterium]
MVKKITLSSKNKGIIGLAGHAGIAHAHGANGFQQDDSVGFCAAGKIAAEALGVETHVKSVSCTTESITVSLSGGGSATTCPRRRVTPQEAQMMKRAEGSDALFSQGIAAAVFGRVYGQGAGEPAACFQAALTLAVIDAFKKASPDKVFVVPESSDNAGVVMGTVVDYGDIPVALVIPVNYTAGGIGPDEDYEGNYMHGEKGEMMSEIGFPLPTIVAESKVYSFLSEKTEKDSFLIRYSKEKGNPDVAMALEASCRELGLPYIIRDDLLSYDGYGFQSLAVKFAEKLENQAFALRNTEKASVKVRIVAELARMVSEDAASFTYMSRNIFTAASSPGLQPGTAAVLSMIVCKQYITDNVIPLLTETERDNYVKIILSTIIKLAEHL